MQVTGELQEEFLKTKSLLDQKYAILEGKFKELEELYEGRPSRPEDLEAIKRMQDELVEKDNLLKKAADDMKFYKLELLNREKNYNKVFGANPNIGVMDPRDAKVRSALIAQKAPGSQQNRTKGAKENKEGLHMKASQKELGGIARFG